MTDPRRRRLRAVPQIGTLPDAEDAIGFKPWRHKGLLHDTTPAGVCGFCVALCCCCFCLGRWSPACNGMGTEIRILNVIKEGERAQKPGSMHGRQEHPEWFVHSFLPLSHVVGLYEARVVHITSQSLNSSPRLLYFPLSVLRNYPVHSI